MVTKDTDPRHPDFWKKKSESVVSSTLEKLTLEDLNPYNPSASLSPIGGYSPWSYTLFDGDKFPGGFGDTQIPIIDYWALRARSAELFNGNLYARGLIRRLITNEVNTGLSPEACPEELIIGVPEDSLSDWTEDVENRYGVWGKNPNACDFLGVSTFGELQRVARREALIEGDILVVLRPSQQLGTPRVQLVSGSSVQSPLYDPPTLKKGHTITYGVERDAQKRVVAHWVKQDDGTFKRLPAFGEKSKRRISWLVYGTDKRKDEVRGQPLLALVLQSLKEIDRYRDSTQRKAVINSILALFIKKSEDKPSTLPVSGGAVRKGAYSITDDTGPRKLNIADQIPGLVLEELQTGEEPVGFNSNGTDVNFGVFEAAVIQAIAWANEVPPEILTLAFSNNYSASQAAINEFKIYLNMFWSSFGESLCTPIFIDWLISEVFMGRIVAPGLIEAWRDPRQYVTFGAWTSVEWYGSIKPSTDMVKQAKGSKMLVDECWSTNAREARITTSTKFSKNAKRIKRENQLKVEAARPLMEFKQEFGAPQDGDQDTKVEAMLRELVGDILDDKDMEN